MKRKNVIALSGLLGAVNVFAYVAYAACICWVAVSTKELVVLWWLLGMVFIPSMKLHYHSDDDKEEETL